VTRLFLGHEGFAFPRQSGVDLPGRPRRTEFTCRKLIRDGAACSNPWSMAKTALDGAVSGKDPAGKAEPRIASETDDEKHLAWLLTELLRDAGVGGPAKGNQFRSHTFDDGCSMSSCRTALRNRRVGTVAPADGHSEPRLARTFRMASDKTKCQRH
jgi:hypothetical protein